MKKKVVKKKPSSQSKSPLKKKAIKKSVATRKRTISKKKVAKKKTTTRKRSIPKKKVAKKKTTTRKRSIPKRKIIKKATSRQASKTAIKPRKPRQGERYMNSKQLEYFRNILLSRRSELITEADRTVDYMQTDSNTYADTIDQATQEEEFSLQLKERDRERRLLQKIDEALIQIDKHEYGFCTSCGAEIGISRLEARPTTNQCIDCKQLEEIKERHL